MIKKIELRNRYKSMCQPVPESEKFIYFAMHYQPERTTCPEGGFFSSQYLCVALLSRGLPDGWKIVVKEHPSQFSYTAMGELARWQDYYDDFERLGNVRFVDLSVPSLALVDSAEAVATVTGAVGWEALVRGKPVLYFGSAWYGACEGAYHIRDVETLERALREIQGGSKPIYEHVLAYAAALKSIGARVYTTPTVAKGVTIKEDMAERFFNLLRQSQG